MYQRINLPIHKARDRMKTLGKASCVSQVGRVMLVYRHLHSFSSATLIGKSEQALNGVLGRQELPSRLGATAWDNDERQWTG
jgi:hypothetical protein